MILLQCSYHSGKSITKITPKKILGSLYKIISSLKSKKLIWNSKHLSKCGANAAFTFFDIFSQNLLQRFAAAKNLILVHHIMIPLLGIPVSYNQNFKMGDFLFAIGFLMEASTPFVCLRRILEILGEKMKEYFHFKNMLEYKTKC